MSKRQRRFIYYSSPLVVLFVVFLAVRMKLNAVEANAQMLAQMGQAAQKVLGEYREGVERADAALKAGHPRAVLEVVRILREHLREVRDTPPTGVVPAGCLGPPVAAPASAPGLADSPGALFQRPPG